MNKNPERKKEDNGLEHKEWTLEQEELLAEWAEKAACYRWLHNKSEKYYRIRNYSFTIPVIILSTLTGTANFAMDSFVPEEQKKLAMGIVGGVNIFAGILSTLQNFLRYAELMESHRSISVSWSKFSRNITVELALDTKRRKHAGDFLKICRAEFDRLIEQAPSVDDSIIKEFNKRFKEIDVIKPEICNGLHKCKIYKPTHEEKVELMVANAGSKLLEKRKDHLKTARSWKRNSGKISKSEPLQGIKETSKSTELDSPRRSLDLETASPNVKINITELEKINESNDEDNRDNDIEEFIDAIEPNKNKI
tara:strand:- start:10239 stop:11162 length:924 start_codon:yes stop_codon:yes gene_type:complete